MKDKLKLCPFCGSKGKIITGSFGEKWGQCQNKHCVSHCWQRTEQQAIKAWNTRKEADVLREKVRALSISNTMRRVEMQQEQIIKLQQRITTLESRVGVKKLEKILDRFSYTNFKEKEIDTRKQLMWGKEIRTDIATVISTMVLGEGKQK